MTVEVAFTDASIDFAEAPGGDPVRLERAMARLATTIGVPVARMRQVHGHDVVEVSRLDDVPTADAIVSADPNLALMTRAADCVPVLLAAPESGRVAAVHAGREGLVSGVVVAAVEALRTNPRERVHAWIGPHVCGRCYEVPEQMRHEVSAQIPATWSETSWGTPALDLTAGVEAQLASMEVDGETVGACTMEDPGLWSHRRSGARAGRMAGLVWMRP